MSRKGTMTDKTINSSYLNQEIVLKIYQPETFSSLYKYNICIMQDGDDYYQIGRVATLSDRLHESEAIESTVFVGIHYTDRFDRWKKYHPSGEEHNAYSQFLVHEVVPFLDDYLPTLCMGLTRTLMGDSLAGTLALTTALAYPHTFGKVIMQSPYVDESILSLATKTTLAQTIDIYHTIGTKETNVKTTYDDKLDFVSPNRQLKEILNEKNISYYYKEIPYGEHTWKYWQKDMENALYKMFNY